MKRISTLALAAALMSTGLAVPTVASADALSSALGKAAISNPGATAQLASLLSGATSTGGVENILSGAMAEGATPTDMASALGAAAATSQTPDIFSGAIDWLAGQTGVDPSLLKTAFNAAKSSGLGGSLGNAAGGALGGLGGLMGGN